MAAIEAGIIQRAQLLNLLLEDLYGRATLDFERAIAARAAVCESGISAAAGGACRFRSTAICICWQWIWRARRTGSGGCWRTARRRLRARAMRWRTGPLFRTCCRICSAQSNVRRLAPFFRAQRDALINLAGSDNPRIVLLTPGPYNETYFRAFVSGALSGLHAGGRRGPDGARPASVSENGGRLAAGGCDPAARGR